MLGRSQRNTPVRSGSVPGRSLLDVIRGWVRTTNSSSTPDALIENISVAVEKLSLQIVTKEKELEGVKSEIVRKTRLKQPTAAEDRKFWAVKKQIIGLQNRIQTVNKNVNMVRNVEMDKEITSLLTQVNSYMKAETAEGTDLGEIEGVMDDQDEYLQIEEKRNEHFDQAFAADNKYREMEIEEDDELLALKAAAVEESEPEISLDDLPSVPSNALRASGNYASPSSSRTALRQRTGVQQPTTTTSWDDGW